MTSVPLTSGQPPLGPFMAPAAPSLSSFFPVRNLSSPGSAGPGHSHRAAPPLQPQPAPPFHLSLPSCARSAKTADIPNLLTPGPCRPTTALSNSGAGRPPTVSLLFATRAGPTWVPWPQDTPSHVPPRTASPRPRPTSAPGWEPSWPLDRAGVCRREISSRTGPEAGTPPWEGRCVEGEAGSALAMAGSRPPAGDRGQSHFQARDQRLSDRAAAFLRASLLPLPNKALLCLSPEALLSPTPPPTEMNAWCQEEPARLPGDPRGGRGRQARPQLAPRAQVLARVGVGRPRLSLNPEAPRLDGRPRSWALRTDRATVDGI